MPLDPHHRQAGFSLVETLVAIAIMLVAVASLSQLFGVAAAANRRASRRTLASLAGRQKIEELRSSKGTTLAPSPAEALEADVNGYSDFFDAGRAASFVRRWSIDPLPAEPSSLLVLQVVVLGRAGTIEARLVTLLRKEGA
ncbi:MAG: prepilin-type N-terminal cleavage/methylation domain-containing protein [Luteitalea sp.]|nr:prepilin-type N-terminal cleavage/methylation domain-containing protein [Luteitalea sp.]